MPPKGIVSNETHPRSHHHSYLSDHRGHLNGTFCFSVGTKNITGAHYVSRSPMHVLPEIPRRGLPHKGRRNRPGQVAAPRSRRWRRTPALQWRAWALRGGTRTSWKRQPTTWRDARLIIEGWALQRQRQREWWQRQFRGLSLPLTGPSRPCHPRGENPPNISAARLSPLDTPQMS